MNCMDRMKSEFEIRETKLIILFREIGYPTGVGYRL